MLTHSHRVSVLSLMLALTALSAIRTTVAQEVSTSPSFAASSTTLAPLPGEAPSAEPASACTSCNGLLAGSATVPVPVSISAMPTAATVGPTIAATSIAVRRRASAPASLASRRHGGRGQPEILMIVGGAALLVGLVIGGGAGDAIAIGGGVAGLIGLYQYLQ